MGAFGSHEEYLRTEEVAELSTASGFSRDHIIDLFDRFMDLDTASHGYITTEQLLRLPELAMNPLRSRILAHFNLSSEAADSTINFKDFIRLISPFHHSKSRDEKIRLAFDIFDINRDGVIDREELNEVLGMMTGKNIDPDELGKMVEQILSESDKDGDGKLSFKEFSETLGNVDIEKYFTLGPWCEDDDEE